MALRQSIPLQQYRGHVRTTAPAVEPVTAAELRAQLAETETGLSDDLANDLISEARELIEEMTGLAIITQVWRLSLDNWPAGREQWWDGVRQGAISDIYVRGSIREVRLPRYPLASVDTVTVFDEGGASSAVAIASTFDIDTYQKPGRMVLQNGATWPIALRAANAIQIDYTAGFGASGASVPAVVKRAVKQVAAYLYAHRGDDCDMGDALAAAGSLLGAYTARGI